MEKAIRALQTAINISPDKAEVLIASIANVVAEQIVRKGDLKNELRTVMEGEQLTADEIIDVRVMLDEYYGPDENPDKTVMKKTTKKGATKK